jgi:iron(III) transport system permease protein
MEALNEYAAAAHFGVPTLTMAMYRAWAHAFDLDAAMLLGASLALFTLAIVGIEHLLRGRSRYRPGTRSGLASIQPRLLRGARLAAIYVLVVLVLTPGLIIPLVQLGWWLAIFPQHQLDAVWQALAGTLLLSGGISLTSITIAAMAILAAHTFAVRSGNTGALKLMSHASYGIPGIVLALGVMLLGSANPSLLVQGGMGLLFYALSIRFFSVAHSGMESAWKHRVASYHEATLLTRLSWRQRATTVYLPLLRPAVIGSLILLILDLSKELSATLLLRPIGFNTLATLMYEHASQEMPQQAALPALVMIALTGTLCAIVFRRLNRG